MGIGERVHCEEINNSMIIASISEWRLHSVLIGMIWPGEVLLKATPVRGKKKEIMSLAEP